MKINTSARLLKALVVTGSLTLIGCSSANLTGGSGRKKNSPETTTDSDTKGATDNSKPQVQDPRLVDVISQEVPQANVFMIIDNSESMQDVQAKVAAGIDNLMKGLKGKLSIRVMTSSQLWFNLSVDGSGSGLNYRGAWLIHPPVGAPATGANPFLSGFKRRLLSPLADANGNRPEWVPSMKDSGLAPVENYMPELGFVKLDPGGATVVELDAGLPESENLRRLVTLKTAIAGIGIDGGKVEAPLCAVRQLATNFAKVVTNDAPNAIIFITDEDDAINPNEQNEFGCPKYYETGFDREAKSTLRFTAGNLQFSMLNTHSIKSDTGAITIQNYGWHQPVASSVALPPVAGATPRQCTAEERDTLYSNLVGNIAGNAGSANTIVDPIDVFRLKPLSDCTVTDKRQFVNITINQSAATCASSNFSINHPHYPKTQIFTNVSDLLDKIQAHQYTGDRRRWIECTDVPTEAYDGAASIRTVVDHFGRYRYGGNAQFGNLDRSQDDIVLETVNALRSSMTTPPILAGLINRGAANPEGCGAKPENESKYLEKFISTFGGDIASVCEPDKYADILSRLRQKLASVIVRTYRVPTIVAKTFQVFAIRMNGETVSLKADSDYQVNVAADGVRTITLTSMINISDFKQLRFNDSGS